MSQRYKVESRDQADLPPPGLYVLEEGLPAWLVGRRVLVEHDLFLGVWFTWVRVDRKGQVWEEQLQGDTCVLRSIGTKL